MMFEYSCQSPGFLLIAVAQGEFEAARASGSPISRRFAFLLCYRQSASTGLCPPFSQACPITIGKATSPLSPLLRHCPSHSFCAVLLHFPSLPSTDILPIYPPGIRENGGRSSNTLTSDEAQYDYFRKIWPKLSFCEYVTTKRQYTQLLRYIEDETVTVDHNSDSFCPSAARRPDRFNPRLEWPEGRGVTRKEALELARQKVSEQPYFEEKLLRSLTWPYVFGLPSMSALWVYDSQTGSLWTSEKTLQQLVASYFRSHGK